MYVVQVCRQGQELLHTTAPDFGVASTIARRLRNMIGESGDPGWGVLTEDDGQPSAWQSARGTIVEILPA